MKKIFKYPLPVSGFQRVAMPVGAVPLSAQMQGDQLTLWAVVDTEALDHEYGIAMIGTGHDGPEDTWLYISTVQHPDDRVLHIYITAAQ